MYCGAFPPPILAKGCVSEDKRTAWQRANVLKSVRVGSVSGGGWFEDGGLKNVEILPKYQISIIMEQVFGFVPQEEIMI